MAFFIYICFMAKKDKTNKPDTSMERGEKGYLLKGNKMHLLRGPDNQGQRKPGGAKTPEELFDLMVQYIQWCEDNPIWKNEAIKGGERAGEIIQIPTDRPWTIKGFCSYVMRSRVWYRKMRFDRKGQQDWLDIMEWFDNTCESQRLDFALVGIYPASLVASLDEYKKESYEMTDEDKEKKSSGFKIEIVQNDNN